VGKGLLVVIVVVTFVFGVVAGYLIALNHITPEPRPAGPGGGRPAGPAGDADGVDTVKLAKFSRRLDTIEKTMDRFYRVDPVDKANATIGRLVDEHNAWVKAANAEQEAQREAFNQRLARVNGIRERIVELDKRLAASTPNPTDKAGVEAYNALVGVRNSLFAEYEELGKLYEADVKAANAAVERAKQEQADRQARLEAAKADAQAEIDAYRKWVGSDEGSAFAMQVNRLYAELHQARRRVGAHLELDACIDRVRAARHDLGVAAAKRQAESGGQLIVVPATLCRREECFLIVDTGATCVAVSPTLVEVLGLSDAVGDEVQVSLAGGVKIWARKLLLPQVSVFGREASDVQAVVLKESEPGIDGLLGLSFLNRFNYRIDETQDPKLVLVPRPE